MPRTAKILTSKHNTTVDVTIILPAEQLIRCASQLFESRDLHCGSLVCFWIDLTRYCNPSATRFALPKIQQVKMRSWRFSFISLSLSPSFLLPPIFTSEAIRPLNKHGCILKAQVLSAGWHPTLNFSRCMHLVCVRETNFGRSRKSQRRIRFLKFMLELQPSRG